MTRPTRPARCPFQYIDGQAGIISTSVLADPGADDQRATDLLTPYVPGVTVKAVRAHRRGACGCVTLDGLANPGECSPDPLAARTGAPKGWEPGVRYEGGIPVEVTTAAVIAASQDEAVALATERGLPVGVLPDGYTLRLAQANFDPAAWHRDEEGGDAVTRQVWRLKFTVVPDVVAAEAKSADDLIRVIERHKPVKRPEPVPEGVSFVAVYGDMQIGKVDDAGGTAETIERVLGKTDAAVDRLKALRKVGVPVNQITLPVLGDCVEGFSSQGGKLAWRQDLAPTEQIRVYRRLMLEVIRRFAPLADRVVVPVVPGNHDDAQRNLVTLQNDDFATEGIAAVADALAMNPEAYGHVTCVFPHRDRSTVTLDICGTITGLAHGHQVRQTAKEGAHAWWAQQAHGLQPIGEASLLVTAHYHHLRLLQPGRKTWLQIPALDNGSRWWTEKTGAEAPAGLVTMTVGGGGWDNLCVI